MPAVLFYWKKVLYSVGISVAKGQNACYTQIKYDVYGGVFVDISDRIKELRNKTGLSQSKFSAKFGIPVRTDKNAQEQQRRDEFERATLERQREYIEEKEKEKEDHDSEFVQAELENSKPNSLILA